MNIGILLVSMRGVAVEVNWRKSALAKLLEGYERKENAFVKNHLLYPKTETQFIRRCLKLHKDINRLTAIKQDLEIIITNTRIMTTTTVTKEQLYDEVGRYNRIIFRLEHEIPILYDLCVKALEEEDTDHEQATQKSLHEKRLELSQAKDSVKALRLTLIGRLEMDIESCQRRVIGASMKETLQISNDRETLQTELNTLHKLVSQ